MPNGEEKFKPYRFTITREPRRKVIAREPEVVEPTPVPRPTWPEGQVARTWDIPVKDEKGEVMALVKPDNTVWAGGEQIGSYDLVSGTFIPRPQTIGEQFGQTFQQIGIGAIRGLGYLFKPFEYYHEYVAKPWTMAITAPWWSEGKPLRAETAWEFFKGFMPGGKFEETYMQWEAPKYLKGALEIVPWFFLPPFFRIGRWLGTLGPVGRVAAKGLTPYVALERGTAAAIGLPFKGLARLAEKIRGPIYEGAIKSIEVPIKVNGKVVDKVVRPAEMRLPDLIPAEDLIADGLVRHPERFGLGKLQRLGDWLLGAPRVGREDELQFKTVEYVLRRWGTTQEGAVAQSYNILRNIGSVKGLFKIADDGVTVLSKNIVPKKKGYSMCINDILTKPGNYRWVGKEGQIARQWREAAYVLMKACNEFRTANIKRPLKFGELQFEGTEAFFPRRVIRQTDVKTGKVIYERNLYPAGSRGGTTPSWKPRTFAEQAEGKALGYEYGPQDEVLAAYINELYNMAKMEKGFAMLEHLGKTPLQMMEMMEKGIVAQSKAYGEEIKGLRYIQQAINRVKRGEILPKVTIAAIARRNPDAGRAVRILADQRAAKLNTLEREFPHIYQLILDKGRQLKLIPPKVVVPRAKPPVVEIPEVTPEMEFSVERTLKNISERLTAVKAEAKAFAPRYRDMRQRAINAGFREGRIVDLPQWTNKIIPDIKNPQGKIIMTGRGVADRIEKIYKPEKVSKALGLAHRASRGMVMVKAALDLSLMTIQGPLVLGHDIVRWASLKKSNAFYNLVKWNLKAIFNPKNAGALEAADPALAKYCAEIGVIMEREAEFIETVYVAKQLKRIPLAGKFLAGLMEQTYGRAGAGFSTGSKAARMTIVKHLKDGWIREGNSPLELGEFVNKLTGVISSKELGVGASRRAGESALLFAPRYTRAYLMVIRDLLRGTKTANEVRKSMIGMLFGGFAGYTALCTALGQEPKLNPAPKALGGDGPEFLSFKIGNSIIGLPGFWYSAIRMLTAVSLAAEEDPERLLSLDLAENDFLRWVMGRASPVVGVGRDIITGRDFIGRRLDEPEDWFHQFAEYFMTIAAANLWVREPHEEEGKGKRFGAEIFGLRAFPQSEWNRLKDMRDEYAQKDFAKPFEELNREEKNKLIEAHGDYNEFYEEAKDRMVLQRGEDFEIALWEVRKLGDAYYYSGLENAAQAVVSGQIDYRTFLGQRDFLKRNYKGQKWALNQIRNIMDPDRFEQLEKWQEKYQRPEDEALDRYWEILSNPSMKAGVADWDTTEKRLQSFLDSLDTETRAYVLSNKDPKLDEYPPLARKLEEIQVEGRDMVREYYDQPEGRARIAYRRENPTVDAWLLLMGRVSVPQTIMAQQLVVQMLSERGLPVTLLPRIGALIATREPMGAPTWGQREAAPTGRTFTIRR